MKKILLSVSLFAFLSFFRSALAQENRFFYAMGKLDGIADGINGPSEASVLLGKNSAPFTTSYSQGKRLFYTEKINPFNASVDPLLGVEVKKFYNKYVWIKYIYSPATEISGDEFKIVEIDNVRYHALKAGNQQSKTLADYRLPDKKIPRTLTSNVRIVKIQPRNDALRSWCAVVQIGNLDNFRSLTILDDDLAEFAIECLKGGRIVKISFQDMEIGGDKFYDTPYFICSIEK